MPEFILDDGGRAAAGYRGKARDVGVAARPVEYRAGRRPFFPADLTTMQKAYRAPYGFVRAPRSVVLAQTSVAGA
jgi:hypothetical protein